METFSYDKSRAFTMDLPSSYYSNNFSKLEYNEPNMSIDELPIPKLDDPNIHYRCPRCFNFPLIDFIDKNEEIIIYSCACFKERRVKIKDLFNKEKNYLSFHNVNSNSKIEDIIGYKCTKHKSYNSISSEYNKFEYYCLSHSCYKNLCKKCIEEHLKDSHDLFNFDYQNFETIKKMNDIIKFENDKKNEIEIEFESGNNINLSGLDKLIEDEEGSEKYINEIKEFKLVPFSKNKVKRLLKKDLENIHNNFIKLINIIMNDYSLYPNYIHFSNIQNIYRVLIKDNKPKEKLQNEKNNSSIPLIFKLGEIKITLSCALNEKIEDTTKRFAYKTQLEWKKYKYFYNGYELKGELKIEDIINEKDKEENIMEIKVVEICDVENIKIKEVKCPECNEDICLNFINYKINLKECKNGHKKNKILFKDFMKTQHSSSSSSSDIYCDTCYRSYAYKSSFFQCFSCNKKLCLPCKKKHDKRHQIIEYKELNYICNKHNGIYQKYCITCKKNICVNCENEHMGHNSVNFKNIISDKESLLKSKEKLKMNIEKFKNEIKQIIFKLNYIMNNFEIYYKIFTELLTSYFEINHKNYQIIQNINEFIKYNSTISEDIFKIINNSNIKEKLDTLFKLCEEMSNKNYITGEIYIDKNNINKDIRIINSYEQRKREGEIINKKNDSSDENEKKLKENCYIFINDNPIEFSYFYKFNKIGLYKIKYQFMENLTNTNDMFANCSFIKKLDFSNFNSEYVNNMCSMFYGCNKLEEINLSSFNTEKVVNMSYMFFGCESLKFIDFSNFNTKNVVDMGSFLSGCKSLTQVDFSNFDIKKVKDLSWMFFNCNSLIYINLSNFYTDNVIYMNTMFYGLKFDNEKLNIYTKDRKILKQIIKYPIISKKIFLFYPDCILNVIKP